LAIEGDLRFLSHHDTMRAIERAASRAELPLHYSQGFNPRAVYSLICPRPVGVATLDDCLVLALDGSIDTADSLARLNRNCPDGMRFTQATVLEGAKTLHPKRVTYEMALSPSQVTSLTQRLDQLHSQDAWLVSRRAKPRRGRGKGPGQQPPASRDVDIKPMLAKLEIVDNDKLRFVCEAHNEAWARPGEALALLDMTGPEQLAKLTRTRLETDQAEQTKTANHG